LTRILKRGNINKSEKPKMKNAKPNSYLVSRESYLANKKEVRSQYSGVRRLLADGVLDVGV